MNGIKMTGGILIFILILSACKESDSKDSEQSTDIVPGELRFENQLFDMQLPSCATDSLGCARVKATFPMATHGIDRICKNINDSISFYVRESLSVLAVSRNDVLQSMDSIAQQFFDDYQELLAQTSDYQLPWEVETTGEVLFQSPALASIKLNNYSFTGGAHPNSYTTLLNFDLRSGRLLKLEDLIADMQGLENIVESEFRTYHQLGEEEDLNEAGFFWDQEFYLPANFAVVDSGLHFFYNPYEAAAYAVGPTTVVVKNEALEGIIK